MSKAHYYCFCCDNSYCFSGISKSWNLSYDSLTNLSDSWFPRKALIKTYCLFSTCMVQHVLHLLRPQPVGESSSFFVNVKIRKTSPPSRSTVLMKKRNILIIEYRSENWAKIFSLIALVQDLHQRTAPSIIGIENSM